MGCELGQEPFRGRQGVRELLSEARGSVSQRGKANKALYLSVYAYMHVYHQNFIYSYIYIYIHMF